MPVFCVNCGAPLADGAGFCSKCGTAVAGRSGATPAIPSIPVAASGEAPPIITPVTPVPTPVTPQSSNTGIKIIFAILAVVVFLGLLMAGGCFYFAYRVRQKAHEFSSQMGGDVTPYTGRREPCKMLPSSDASKILGQPVDSVRQIGTRACEYDFGSDGKHVDIEYTWTSGAMTMKLAHGAMKQISGTETMTPIDGLGDEAYLSPAGSGLMMRKGDVMVNIDLRVSGVSTDQAKKMAAEIADNLQ